MTSIPISQLVNVTPGVVAAGGTASALTGLALTASTRVPIGAVQSFPTAQAVGNYFGLGSAEYAFATVYFAGSDGSNLKPAALFLAQYPTAAVAGYLRGGNVSALTLAQLQALSGTITLSVDGTPRTSSAINLTGAASFSAAAALIATALGAGVTVVYDSQSGGFLITSSTTGANSAVNAITAGTGNITVGLALTTALGAVVSPGSAVATPAAYMGGLVNVATNFASFTTLGFKPTTADMIAFAAWNSTQNNDYVYVGSDNDLAPTTTVPATGSFGPAVATGGYSGTLPVYDSLATTSLKAAFVMGALASIDFTQTNGRTTLAYRSQAGIVGDVTNAAVAANLQANGYNFVGNYGNIYNIVQNGQISGPFLWADSYVNQVKLTADLQLAAFNLLRTAKSIPYNAIGYGLIEQACSDPINSALNFGSIRAGVNLSAAQRAIVNAAAGGLDIGTVLSTRGWYLLITPATSAQRAARGSPGITLFYVDGQSVQIINIAAIEVQ